MTSREQEVGVWDVLPGAVLDGLLLDLLGGGGSLAAGLDDGGGQAGPHGGAGPVRGPGRAHRRPLVGHPGS